MLALVHAVYVIYYINEEAINARENVALCCVACNAGKKQKPLKHWIKSDYCKCHGINADTVAPINRRALED